MNEDNSDFLDIYMEGATAGWIAVGFSDTASMVCVLYIARVTVAYSEVL